MNRRDLVVVGGLALLAGCLGEAGDETALAAERSAATAVASFVVDRTNDSNDGSCETPGGCNLRAAVRAATAIAGLVEIELGVDAEIALGELWLPAGSDLRVIGSHAITGNGYSRLFQIDAGARLELTHVTVSGFAAYDGGAILNHGEVELDGAVLSGNQARCSATGAMTAFATCMGGAVASDGELRLTGGTRFEGNAVVSEAYTASFTNSSGIGGAIASSGHILVDGPVVFADNRASATAISGVHPIPVSGAWASSAGGAIYSVGGSLTFSVDATGHCAFTGNAAEATAQAIGTPGVPSALGGAIYSTGTLVMADDACSFDGNLALGAGDVFADPPAIAPVGVSLDEATQSIVFHAPAGTEWADLHLTVNGQRPANLRMQQTGSRFVVGPLALRADDELAYSITYFEAGVGHDTEVVVRRVPLSFEPRVLRAEVRDDVVRLVGDVDWADVHYSVNGGPQLNVRLPEDGLALSLAPGDRLRYWLTYAAGGFVLESGDYVYAPTAPTAFAPWVSGSPGAQPGQLPAGCAPDAAWYACAPFDFTRVQDGGGYDFVDDAGRVPFGVVGIGPFGEYLVKTFRIAFTRGTTGFGLVQVPTSAVGGGVAPGDVEDRDLGKFVSPLWNLRASYMIGGEGLTVALVDVNGLRGPAVELVPYRSTYCRYGCSLRIPVAELAAGSEIDLGQIRYLEFRTQSGASADQSLVLGHVLFDDFAF